MLRVKDGWVMLRVADLRRVCELAESAPAARQEIELLFERACIRDARWRELSAKRRELYQELRALPYGSDEALRLLRQYRALQAEIRELDADPQDSP